MDRQACLYRRSDRIRSWWTPYRVILTAWMVALLMLAGPVRGQIPGLPGSGGLVHPAKELPEVVLEVVPQFDQVAPGKQFALAVVLRVKSGWHLYANPNPGVGLKTEILPKPHSAFNFGRVIYPTGGEFSYAGSVDMVYDGTTICYVPLEVVFDATEKEFTIKLQVKGQLCQDQGICKLWQDERQVIIKVVREASAVEPIRPDLFADLDLSAGWRQTDQDTTPTDAKAKATNWLQAVLLALAAGVLMNLMPCVLPIIPIIIMTLMKQCAGQGGQGDRARSIRIGLAFAAGIMIVFVGLAVLMGTFKLLWGQQFQGTTFKFVLLLIVYVLSLSMFGLFEISLPSSVSNITVVRQGYLGALGMGMLATVLATPCGAPLLTPVLAWSLSKPLAVIVAVFLIIGAGMAFPYVLLTAMPKLLGRIPKAGMWMTRLKQAIGFIMLAFTAYLVFLFPSAWHGPLLYLCVLIGFCIWLGMSTVNINTPAAKRYLVRGIALVLLIAGAVSFAMMDKADAAGTTSENWLTQLQQHKQQGRNVIVKFTANWCKNCSALDKLIYKRDVFKKKLTETDTALVVADWSYEDAEIEKMIRKLGGPGQALPFAAVFPAAVPDKPILLRDFYSLDETLKALDDARRIK